GGLLHEPVEMDEITLSPSERAEILIDFSAMESDEPIAITDEEGNALLPFDLDIDGGTEEMESISWTDDTTFLKEEKSLPLKDMDSISSVPPKKWNPYLGPMTLPSLKKKNPYRSPRRSNCLE